MQDMDKIVATYRADADGCPDLLTSLSLFWFQFFPLFLRNFSKKLTKLLIAQFSLRNSCDLHIFGLHKTLIDTITYNWDFNEEHKRFKSINFKH